MKHLNIIRSLLILICFFSLEGLHSQQLEWRAAKQSYSSFDPDGSGPGIGFLSFRIEIRSTSGTISNVGKFSLGWSYHSNFLMLPTGTSCSLSSGTPSNIGLASAFSGFTITNSNQCLAYNETIGLEFFDRRTVLILSGTPVSIGTTWQHLMTVGMWSKTTDCESYGWALMNSSETGDLTNGSFSCYAAYNTSNEQIPVNSISYSDPYFICTLEMGDNWKKQATTKVSLVSPEENSPLVYPTIATDIINVKTQSKEHKPIKILIMNSQGVLVSSTDKILVEGTNLIQLPIDDRFPKGVYFMIISDGTKRTTHKFITM